MDSTRVTVEMRKAEKTQAMALAIAALRKDLEEFARARGGKFVLYGSVSRGDFRYDSDVDILVDFPDDEEADAWRFAEDACRRHGLRPDVQAKRYCEQAFLDHIAGEVEIIL